MISSVARDANSVSFTSRKKKKFKNTKGVVAASLASTAVALPLMMPQQLLANKMVKLNSSLSKDKIKFVNKTAEDVLKSSKLADKGVQIIHLDSMPNILPLPEWLLEMTQPVYAISNGKNAAFTPNEILGIADKNSILINKDKLPLAVFHEMGHAHNYNNSALLKTLQKSRGPLLVLSSILSVLPALTHEEKPQNGEELTKMQKFKNGLRKFAPAIISAASMPIVVEEGIATFKGNKWAKEFLTKDLAKKVRQSNAIGLISYIAATAALSLGAFVARKVKDNSDLKKEMKLNEGNTLRCHQG